MATETQPQMESDELAEWLECIDDVAHRHGKRQLEALLDSLQQRASQHGVSAPTALNTPYINTISVDQQPDFPGDEDLEHHLRSIIRWNAMAMVARANQNFPGIGGHISTYASAAELFEVGFNHFFHTRTEDHPGDFVYFQGHASPGVYARAFLEGRLSEGDLVKFRREAPRETGLSSYPHPWLMPSFWQFPSVSMGLSPIQAIYQARFLKYLQNRNLLDTSKSHVWAFVGDGEMDEPESVGALSFAAREKLDNLTIVVNCNLQRLDGPVRGSGKIIQELESLFRGAGWNVIKVVWGGNWDPLLQADHSGVLIERMNQAVDGDYQKFSVESGDYVREHFFGTSQELSSLVEDMSDEQLGQLQRGGHDAKKVYAAYQAAIQHQGTPTVILAKTIKGYGLGKSAEGSNVTHKQKKLDQGELIKFRDRFEIPLEDEEIESMLYYRPDDESPEFEYLQERRRELGGWLPQRAEDSPTLEIPPLETFDSILQSSGERTASTTMSFGRMLSTLLKDEAIGDRIVPIIPDEARTFGLETLFARCGIYSPVGQQYEPVDADQLIHYHESKDGQLLEEGITEAGSMSSFIAAGTAYSHLQLPMIPFYLFYSMFGFQRVGDLIWAAGDSRAKGFLLGCTAGRTTLNGEGLQHQDGHSQLVATTVPTVVAYDPAFGYEVAVIVQRGLQRMFVDNETIMYYITMYNENYPMPEMPSGVQEGILRGLYRFQSVSAKGKSEAETPKVQLFGSGTILQEVLMAAKLLSERFGVASDVWSVTSYSELRRDCLSVEHWNRLHPQESARQSYLEEALQEVSGPFVAATDFVKSVPDLISRWIPGRYTILGTDGFGRSDTHGILREHFEVNGRHIALTALSSLVAEGQLDQSILQQAFDELSIDPDKPDPATA